jgi:hypothetical protein
VTNDNAREGMAELLAKQRSGLPLTPSEAAAQRRSRRGLDAPAPAGTGSPQDLPPAEDDLPAPGRTQQAIPGPFRRALSLIASNRGTLVAAACAIAVPLVCWLSASRRRKRR